MKLRGSAILILIILSTHCLGQFELKTISTRSGEKLQANCIAVRYSSNKYPNDGQFVLAKLNNELVLQLFYKPSASESRMPQNYDGQIVQFDFYDSGGTLQDHAYIKIEGVGSSGDMFVFDMTIPSLIEKFVKYSSVKVMVKNAEKLEFSLGGFTNCKNELEK
jgi:hypothetical protein